MFSENAAPPGFGYITQRNPFPKRIFWFLVLVGGLIYPTYNFQKQFRKYRRYNRIIQFAWSPNELIFSFPSSIKPVVENLSPEISFPKVTLCANGIHSMSRIKEKYPWLPQEVAEKIYGPPVNTDELNGNSVIETSSLNILNYRGRDGFQIDSANERYSI